LDRPLAAFIHVRNSRPDQAVNPATGGDIWLQEDRLAPGGFATRDIEPGWIYDDLFIVTIPPEMPAGEYFLEFGWVDLKSGEQSDVLTAEPLRVLWRSVLLPSLQIR
jgi:hypothetical protein